ncbi:MAG: hypothetical protein GY861_05635 [bacterium]|nr:hypothetical protein [bacterium]
MEYTEDTYWNTFPNLSREVFFDSKEEFEFFMEKIDQKMIDEGIPPKGRQIKGIFEAAKELKTEVPWVTEEFAKKDDYTILSLAAHIVIWFQKKYEDRLNMGYANKSIAKLKGDFYVLNILTTYGDVELFFDPKADAVIDGYINVAKFIEGLTAYTAERITDQEIKELATLLYNAICLTRALDSRLSVDMLKEAKSDFIQSVEALFRDQLVPGLSKWHSLQFAEKVLKAFIESKNEAYGFTHKLDVLLQKAIECGLKNTEEYDGGIIQCKPEVRYNADLVSKDEAYNAHIEAIKLGVYTLLQIEPKES